MRKANGNVYRVTYKVQTATGEEELRSYNVATRWGRHKTRGLDPADKVLDFLKERDIQTLELVEVKELMRQVIL